MTVILVELILNFNEQIASRVLGIPLNMIHTSEVSTSTVPNDPPTSASCATDLRGGAVNVSIIVFTKLQVYQLL